MVKHLSTMRGYTLIELMVSLSLGLLLVMAATQLFITGQKGIQVQRGVADVEDGGRFVLAYITDITRGAGYNSQYVLNSTNSKSWPAGVLVEASSLPGATTNNLLSKDSKSTALLGNSDQLTVRYYTAVDTKDCEGDNVPAGNYVLARFFIRADTASNSSSALACEGGYHSPTAVDATGITSFDGSNGIVLASAIDYFQVLLAIGNPTTTTGTLQWYTPDNVPAGSLVTVVRIGLVGSSSDSTGSTNLSPTALTVLNETIPTTNTNLKDGRVRRVLSNTIMLRNIM